MNIPFIEFGVVITGVTFRQLGMAVDLEQEWGGPGGHCWESKHVQKGPHFVTFECFEPDQIGCRFQPPKSKGRKAKVKKFILAQIAKLPRAKRKVFKNLKIKWGMVKVER